MALLSVPRLHDRSLTLLFKTFCARRYWQGSLSFLIKTLVLFQDFYKLIPVGCGLSNKWNLEMDVDADKIQKYVFITLVIAAIIAFCLPFYLFFHPIIPHSFDPGVRLGSGMFHKTMFFEDSRLDYVSDIKYGRLRSRRGFEYCIVGNMGGVFLDKNIQLVEFIKLKNERFPITDFRIVLDGRGQCSFIGKIDHNHGFPVYPFELDGQELPFIYKDDCWIAAEGTDNEIRFPLPFFNDVRGTSVYFGNGKNLYYAVLGKRGLQAPLAGYTLIRLNLFILDSSGRLIYNEVLEDDARILCTAIKAVSLEGSAGQFLLVGGASKVWKYMLTDGKITQAKRD